MLALRCMSLVPSGRVQDPTIGLEALDVCELKAYL
jgi:hypothetical protein